MWIIVPFKVLLFFFLHSEKSQNVPESHVSLQCKCHVLMCQVLIASTFGYFYRPQRSCGKVMFSHLSVSHSVHRGVSATHTPLGRHPLPSACWHTHTPLPSACWDTHPLPSACLDTPPLPHSACWDTVNKRAVRILLECTLVFIRALTCLISCSLCVVNSCVSISVHRPDVFILRMLIWSKYPLLLFTQQMVNNSRIIILRKNFYFILC